MSRTLVRLVGGENAGKEVWHDPICDGPVIRMMLHPDFTACKACLSGGEPIDPETLVTHHEEYYIHKIVFDEEGHRHYYAAPGKRQLIDIMNQLWDGYRIYADMERRNGH